MEVLTAGRSDSTVRGANARGELIDALAERVNPDGSWTNKDAERWEEGNPVLSTCYGALALEEALR